MDKNTSYLKTMRGRVVLCFVAAAIIPLVVLSFVVFNGFFGAMGDTSLASQLVASLRTSVILIFVVAALGAAAAGHIVLGGIIKPISVLAEDAARINRGDLSQTVTVALDRQDEVGRLGRAFSEMLENIREIVLHAVKIAREVANSTHQLSANAEENSSAAEEIASTVQEMSVEADKQTENVRAVTDLVNRNSDFIKELVTIAENVSEAALEVMEKAETGNKSIATAVRQMNTINKVVTDSAKEVFDLGERSKQIGQIIKTITDIADQTNLLALNAAIEAARAGEQGRGFAVVAEEVRKLAEQSSEAAAEISEMIKGVQEETYEAVKLIEEGTEEVKTGLQVMGEAGKAFQGVRRAVRHISQQAEASSQAARDLEEASRTIAESMDSVVMFAQNVAASTENVAAVTEEQAASMEEVTSSAIVLSQMAEELQKSLSHFTVSDEDALVEDNSAEDDLSEPNAMVSDGEETCTESGMETE